MDFIAHTTNPQGFEHSLNDHLRSVSELMNSFADDENYRKVFRITGLLHDFGKYQLKFQKYLRNGGKRGSVPHASWGAAIAKKYKLIEASFAIDGHHKGLPDNADLQDDCVDFEDGENSGLYSVRDIFFKDTGLQENYLEYSLNFKHTEREIFIRYLFSSLTDADWLDTEKHFNEEIKGERKAHALNADLLTRKLEMELSGKNKKGYLNELRNKVRDYAVSHADKTTGFYSMTLPTGMGKTLSSLSWALKHAKHNQLQRIIIVLPFISIIDQTAMELKRIFGEEWVLEHHSGFNEDETVNEEIRNEGSSIESYGKRLATENWDYPVIVTTSVQFFESLFSNRPSRCRKVHNIARSVVIFDEVQTLPKEIVLPTLSVLKSVQKVMDTSFLFCTATQPAFEKRENFNGIDNIISLVENPKEIFKATRRVTYESINEYDPVNISELAHHVLSQDVSTLVVFNTKAKALLFFKEVRHITGFRAFHLSTGMYPLHRKRVIEEIRDCLQRHEKILVSSTQLIEAGVDFDFPCVCRETAPLESIIQAAGRCNREGRMEPPGRVFIFTLVDSAAPNRQYRSLAEFAITLYKGKERKLYEHDFFGEYYRKALSLLVDPDKSAIEEDREKYQFKTIAGKYRLINDSTTPLFILCSESRELYESIRHKVMLSRVDYRLMQQYSVQAFEKYIKDNIGKIGKEPQGYLLWHGEYNDDYGITTENPLLIL